METSHRALIIDPDGASRSRLKGALRMVPRFVSIDTVDHPDDALALVKARRVDLVFIGRSVNQRALQSFLAEAKSEGDTGDVTCVPVCARDKKYADVAGYLAAGADGLLIEPYSIENIVDIIELADRRKREFGELRVKKALGLLVNELADQVAQLARLEKAGRPSRISRTVFKEMCSVLPQLEPPMLENYFDILFDVFSQRPAECETVVSRSGYSGVSERVRQRFSNRAVQALKSALAA